MSLSVFSQSFLRLLGHTPISLAFFCDCLCSLFLSLLHPPIPSSCSSPLVGNALIVLVASVSMVPLTNTFDKRVICFVFLSLLSVIYHHLLFIFYSELSVLPFFPLSLTYVPSVFCLSFVNCALESFFCVLKTREAVQVCVRSAYYVGCVNPATVFDIVGAQIAALIHTCMSSPAH